MLEEFKSYRENNRLEAKLAQGGLPKSVWETYSAFANSMGSVILLGVEEDPKTGELVARGVSDAAKMLDDFWNTVNNDTKVSANILKDSDVAVLDVDGMDVVRINVPRADRLVRPVYINGHLERSFRRNHAGDYLCRLEDIKSLLRDASSVPQDSTIMERVGLDELSAPTVEAYRRRYKLEHGGHAWNEYDAPTFLRAIGAAGIGEDGQVHPTLAGLLMFGIDWRICEEMPEYFLDYRQETSADTRWQNRVVSKGGDWTGNLYDFYYRVYNLMKQALKVPFKLEGITRVDDTPAHKALREALVNALVNANYYERRGVVCVWYEDKVTISNPGDFRISLDAAMQPGESDPRNGNLLAMFSYIDVGERAGSGLPSLVERWVSCGYAKPYYEFAFAPDRTKLVLPLTPATDKAPINIDKVSITADNPPITDRGISALRGLGPTALAALKIASDKGRVSTAPLAETAGVSKQTAASTLKKLSSLGILSWHGKSNRDPWQYYELTPKYLGSNLGVIWE